MDDLN
jgi:hypothetical protein